MIQQGIDLRPFVVETILLTQENLIEVVTWAKRNCAESVEALFDEKGVPTGLKMGINFYVNVGLWLVLKQRNYHSWWPQQTYENYIRMEKESGWEYKYRNHKPMSLEDRYAILEHIRGMREKLFRLEEQQRVNIVEMDSETPKLLSLFVDK
jgi:hypothetical protein